MAYSLVCFTAVSITILLDFAHVCLTGCTYSNLPHITLLSTKWDFTAFTAILSLHVVQHPKSDAFATIYLCSFACSYALAVCDLLHLAEALEANDVPICLQEEQRELAKTIRVSGSILLSTVSNFLDFFKMEAGKQLDVVRTEITTKVMPSPLPPSDIPL